jgi:hypothetical protein
MTAELFAGTDAEREQARIEAEAEELIAEMRRPLADISAKAGRMERDSPLFYGTGENPNLF